MLERQEQSARQAMGRASDCDYCSIRLVEERSETLSTRRGVTQPLNRTLDVGAMVSILHQGGYGYAATSDTSSAGLQNAVERARRWALQTRTLNVFDGVLPVLPHSSGEYRTHLEAPWLEASLSEKLDLVHAADRALAGGEPVVDWQAALWWQRVHSVYLTTGGGRVEQLVERLGPDLSITASERGCTQTRSLGAYAMMRQGGLEVLDAVGYQRRATELGHEVRQLLAAPNCPSAKTDIVLMPDQMVLQVHESIGHPLELDRILGDERNYAGQSFVTPEMLGSYQYGSELLNVSFDPERGDEAASYAYDDEGHRAEKCMLIERGILLRPLGGLSSSTRLAHLMPALQSATLGTASARSDGWNRPPIDRMANLNLEPGESTLDELIAGVEQGLLMRTNCSWSIDDSRNKFQFGCEWGQQIRNGELGEVVRNPNYRGVSASFWRNLTGVGNEQTHEVMAAAYCGKGEPNQVVTVGHATPACRFRAVDVFGGD